MEEQVLKCVILAVAGLCFGSFAGASVWRLRLKQLIDDKKNHLKIDQTEYKKLQKLGDKSIVNDRSVCLNCSYQLRWFDMIPLVSWISLGGKCRKCRQPIGLTELLIEVFMMIFFVGSFLLWPTAISGLVSISEFILWLIMGVLLGILFIYDLKWMLMPDKIAISAIAVGLVNSLIVIISSNNKLETILSIVGSLLILCGLYLSLYIVSKGKWIGFGDVKLGLALALMLADWRLAFLALFVANLIGCFVTLPGLIIGKLNKTSHIPFGPFLIIGFVLTALFGQIILNSFFYNLV